MWNEFYITGQDGYKKKVRKSLAKSDLIEGEDYIEGSSNSEYTIYWVKPELKLKEFKLAIKAKNIWKYRVRIETNFPKYEDNTHLTNEDEALISKYRKL